jgi:AraC family transcriptional activator of pobA
MLDQRAMLDAKRALLYTNMSVAEVGYAIGFSDPAYFTRFFSRQAGVSPSAYRGRGRLTPGWGHGIGHSGGGRPARA